MIFKSNKESIKAYMINKYFEEHKEDIRAQLTEKSEVVSDEDVKGFITLLFDSQDEAITAILLEADTKLTQQQVRAALLEQTTGSASSNNSGPK